ncbi:endolytic transglycosylase MltG [Rickettsiales bacterium]|nr:endolytic transglycosylase MltG [Rickettsiales bacterium]
MGRYLSLICSAGFFCAIIIVSGLYYFLYKYSVSSIIEQEKIVVIPSGSSLKKISAILDDNEVINYPQAFTYLAWILEKEQKIKAGEYKFNPGETPRDIIDRLSSGDILVHYLTIPEGLMTSQILQIISQTDNLSGELPDNIKEGSMLPETYDYRLGDTKKMMVKRMQSAMSKFIDERWEERAENLPIKTKEEAIILASIVEKETGVPQERGRVASVFINRMQKKMRLQTDPSVIYGITKGEYVLERQLRKKDLNEVTPYNTYRKSGLPPGPISNPGKDAIIAVLNPPKTNDIYFVADGVTGGHRFSTNLRDHNNNVNKLRKVERQRREN